MGLGIPAAEAGAVVAVTRALQMLTWAFADQDEPSRSWLGWSTTFLPAAVVISLAALAVYWLRRRR